MMEGDDQHQRRERCASISLPVRLVDQLRTEARRRGLRRDELAEAIIANVVDDDRHS